MPEPDVADRQQDKDRKPADPKSVANAGRPVGPLDCVLPGRNVDGSEHSFEAVSLCGFTVDRDRPAGEVEIGQNDGLCFFG